MYPFARLALVTRRARKRPRLAVDDPAHLRLTCWPWDIDMYAEMNNGRVLTLYDLGRFDHAVRIGLVDAIKARGWGFAVGGASVRYRRRVRAFDRLDLSTQAVGMDARWFYMHQVMRRKGDAVSAGLMRICCTNADGIVPTADVMAALGAGDMALPPAPWVQAWIDAEAARPWPPEIPGPPEPS
jgi:acyl-CoA thioesterase FadM